MSNERQWQPTPTMEPGEYTTYQVLDWVLGRVTEEQKRLNMARWVSLVMGERVLGICSDPACTLCTPVVNAADMPACGTVACLGGWCMIGLEGTGFPIREATSTRIIRRLGLSLWSEPAKALEKLFSAGQLEPERAIDRLKEIMEAYRPELETITVTRGEDRV